MSQVPDSSEFSQSRSEQSLHISEFVHRFGDQLRAISAWASISLPFLYLPLLFTGLNTVTQTIAFLLLLSLNALMIHLWRVK